MRSIIFIFIFLSIIFTSTWFGLNLFPETKSFIVELFQKDKFQTLEVRFSAEKIMETYKKELIKDNDHIYLDPSLIFYPYLLMEVKYTKDSKTGEGLILWSLIDGEMVTNTYNWEKTHGFNDCINVRASREDFKIINALSINGGSMDRETLSKALNIENDTLILWAEKCRTKNLIVQNGNNFRLHLQEPKIQVTPETKIDQWLVSKPVKNAKRLSKKLRSSQIESVAKAAFGNDFTIRRTSEIFLPVYNIVVQNPDGSQTTTYWNALNGKRFSQRNCLLE